jgi:hypothetical protein
MWIRLNHNPEQQRCADRNNACSGLHDPKRMRDRLARGCGAATWIKEHAVGRRRRSARSLHSAGMRQLSHQCRVCSTRSGYALAGVNLGFFAMVHTPSVNRHSSDELWDGVDDSRRRGLVSQLLSAATLSPLWLFCIRPPARKVSTMSRIPLKPSRYKSIYGGRGGGKSHFYAELLVA